MDRYETRAFEYNSRVDVHDEYGFELMEEAEERYNKRMDQHRYGVGPKLAAFFEQNPLFSDVYVMNGVSKAAFAKRIVNQRSYFVRHLHPKFRYQVRLNEMRDDFSLSSDQEKADILDELCCLCAQPAFFQFVQLDNNMETISDMLQVAFESRHTTQVELAAFLTAHLTVNISEELCWNNRTSAEMYDSLLKALRDCYSEITDFAIRLVEQRYRHLDDKLRGATNAFSYKRYRSSFGRGHHRLGSILYYTAALMLDKSYLRNLLSDTARCALSSFNPLQFFLLKLLTQRLVHLEELAQWTPRPLEHLLSQGFVHLFSFDESDDRFGVCDRVCRELVQTCRSLARSIMRASGLRSNLSLCCESFSPRKAEIKSINGEGACSEGNDAKHLEEQNVSENALT